MILQDFGDESVCRLHRGAKIVAANSAAVRGPASWSNCSATRFRRRPAEPGGHPCQAHLPGLRVAVNAELDSLRAALPAALAALAAGGRAVVMAYQSFRGQDRQDGVRGGHLEPVAGRAAGRTAGLRTGIHRGDPGAERADADEIERNPRSAAVRLRAVQRVQGRVAREQAVQDAQGGSRREKRRRASAVAVRYRGRPRRNDRRGERRPVDAPARDRRPKNARTAGPARDQRAAPAGPLTAPMPRVAPARARVRPRRGRRHVRQRRPRLFGFHCGSG